ncbi:MAG: DUF6520 family protein [Algibacter sp.]
MKTKTLLPAFAIIFAIALSSFTVNDDFQFPMKYYDNPNISGIESTIAIECDGIYNACTIQIGPNTYQLYYTNQLQIPCTKF